jgi:hypothetical protein
MKLQVNDQLIKVVPVHTYIEPYIPQGFSTNDCLHPSMAGMGVVRVTLSKQRRMLCSNA